ncbi:unnamed protein product [Cyprideis torosa]|uniref:Uncharacterized protein n=1 Tax=Cyprideis torosa TaxID=163714 RepID=A0A7R8ZSC4_9CRUS|nr:unnamed protein product [Cyprideis torosa]CAG0906434.1 unnamed protein product [Cyprideis torosa]
MGPTNWPVPFEKDVATSNPIYLHRPMFHNLAKKIPIGPADGTATGPAAVPPDPERTAKGTVAGPDLLMDLPLGLPLDLPIFGRNSGRPIGSFHCESSVSFRSSGPSPKLGKSSILWLRIEHQLISRMVSSSAGILNVEFDNLVQRPLPAANDQ